MEVSRRGEHCDSLSTLTVDSEVIWTLVGMTYSMVKQRPFSSPGETPEAQRQAIRREAPGKNH